jgi:hypothetical protein
VLNVTSFWLFALATSVFSAMNERELRQRRPISQALVELGPSSTTSRPVRQSQIVLDGLATVRLPARRRLGATEAAWSSSRDRRRRRPDDAGRPDAVVDRAGTAGPAPVRRLDPARNPSSRGSAGARNVLVSPMSPTAGRGRRRRRVPPRPSSAASSVASRRSCAAVVDRALNLRNAVLLRHVQDLAERDSLTGAANRRMFQSRSSGCSRPSTPARREPVTRSCSSTSTTSRSSTTRSAMPPATLCSSRSPSGLPGPSGTATSWPASAATSSRS